MFFMNLKLNDDELRTNPRRSVPAIWQQIAVCGISVKETAVSCNAGFPVPDQDKDEITFQAIMLDFSVILWYNQDILVEASIFYD